MSLIFPMVQDDTSPALRAILRDKEGDVVPIIGASVEFIMQAADGTNKVTANAVVNDGAAGDVQYNWVVNDTDTLGYFEAQFRVTFADGRVETFPNSECMQVYIKERL